MLYVSSRDRNDTHTAHVALTCDYAKDGGRFLPFQIPQYSNEEICQLKGVSFNQIMADVLNLFFSARLTSWDIDFCIGKQTCKVVAMSHKILISELWHNPDTDFHRATERICTRLLPDQPKKAPSLWLKSAVRIAAIFATYGQALADGSLAAGSTFDLVVPTEDMIWTIAATIAKKMGLPISTIVCSCRSESNVWDLIQKGTLSTAGLSDVMRSGIEAMLFLLTSSAEVSCFMTCCENGKVYDIGEINPFIGNYYCTVAGNNRVEQSINSLFRSNHYIIDPDGAISFSGLQDYRAGTGAGILTMLFSESSPLNFSRVISEATGITEKTVSEYIKL